LIQRKSIARCPSKFKGYCAITSMCWRILEGVDKPGNQTLLDEM